MPRGDAPATPDEYIHSLVRRAEGAIPERGWTRDRTELLQLTRLLQLPCELQELGVVACLDQQGGDALDSVLGDQLLEVLSELLTLGQCALVLRR